MERNSSGKEAFYKLKLVNKCLNIEVTRNKVYIQIVAGDKFIKELMYSAMNHSINHTTNWLIRQFINL